MAAADNRIVIERRDDGDTVTVNGVPIPGASLMFHDDRRVVISIPATDVKIQNEAGPRTRRIALGDDSHV